MLYTTADTILCQPALDTINIFGVFSLMTYGCGLWAMVGCAPLLHSTDVAR